MDITLDLPNSTTVLISFNDNRYSVIRDYLKGVKQEDFTGTWGQSERDALVADPPPVPRITIGEKKYLLSQDRLNTLIFYLDDVKSAAWDLNWSVKESQLMNDFTQVPKDGT